MRRGAPPPTGQLASPSAALPNLDRGALRVSTTLWNPFEGLVFVNDLNAAEVHDLAQAVEPLLEDFAAVTTLDSELPTPLITIVGLFSSFKTFAA